MRWNWVSHGTHKLYNVGILDDDSLYNPNGYPEDIVREAVQAAITRRHAKRSAAAKKAAATRAMRRSRRVQEIVAKFLAGRAIGPSLICACCWRRLDDPLSISRGIGAECWQGILSAVEQAHARAAADEYPEALGGA